MSSRRSSRFDPVEWQLTTAKFLEPVRPGDVLVVEHSADADVIRFAVRVAKPHVADRAGPRRHPGPAAGAPAPHELRPARGCSRRPRKRAEWIGNRERGSSALLKLMVFLSLRLGRRASRGVLYGIALYFFLFAPAARRNSRRYLRLALGRAPTAADRFRHVLYFATCIHDRVYLVKQQYERFDITIEGEALMREQLESGHGAFLMGAHIGSFEVIRSVGRRQPGLQRVDGHVRAQCPQDQCHDGRHRSAGEGRHHRSWGNRRHAAHRRPAGPRRLRRHARRSHT